MPGVYISYPFCSQKCSFCNFASDVGSRYDKAKYAYTLLCELRAHIWDYLPETIFFGGGTPSLMSPELLCDLMSAIPGGHLTEVTMECAPGTISRESVALWRECGVNRVSLGVQSFVSAELRQTGRRHTAAAVERDLDILREGGISNVNLDLIAGLPSQTLDSWNRSLDWMEHLHPPHASVYLFEVDEDSRLGKEVILGGSRYGANILPNDDLCADLYEAAVERLATMGISRYEISNFAREGYQSRHNLKYWKLEPYIGFGLDAHSFDGRYRWGNPDTLPAYFAAREAPDARPLECVEANASEERFFIGLRLTHGIVPSEEEWSRFAVPIDRWILAGMLERAGDRLRLSHRGHLVSNEIFQEFVGA